MHDKITAHWGFNICSEDMLTCIQDQTSKSGQLFKKLKTLNSQATAVKTNQMSTVKSTTMCTAFCAFSCDNQTTLSWSATTNSCLHNSCVHVMMTHSSLPPHPQASATATTDPRTPFQTSAASLTSPGASFTSNKRKPVQSTQISSVVWILILHMRRSQR